MSSKDIDQLVRIGTFQESAEQALKDHISMELNAWYFYKKLAADAARSDIALHGFAMFFGRSANECYRDSRWCENYLVQRGGKSSPRDIPAPKVEFPDEPIDPVTPIRECLMVEKGLLEHLHKLCSIASEAGDNALEDAIEDRFLKKETKHVKDLGDFLQQVLRVSKTPGHGLYHLDRELRVCGGRMPWGSANIPDMVDELIAAEAKEDKI